MPDQWERNLHKVSPPRPLFQRRSSLHDNHVWVDLTNLSHADPYPLRNRCAFRLLITGELQVRGRKGGSSRALEILVSIDASQFVLQLRLSGVPFLFPLFAALLGLLSLE